MKLVPLLVALSLVCSICPAPSAAALVKLDVDLLKVALNFKCLLGEFYSYASNGTGLPKTLRGGGPVPIGGQKALLSPEALKLARDIANDEVGQLKVIRGLLGKDVIPCPQIDIGNAFSTFANAAVGSNVTLNPPFSPYGSDVMFYMGSFILEDIIVAGYAGGVPFVTDPTVSTVGLKTLAVDSYHAGAIRSRLLLIADQYIFPYGSTVFSAASLISRLRATYGEGQDGGLEKLVPTDATSLVYGRTVTQSIRIFYQGAKPGGFFPKGLNGNYK